jgi:type IV secretory pathway VirB2 component (pilin)
MEYIWFLCRISYRFHSAVLSRSVGGANAALTCMFRSVSKAQQHGDPAELNLAQASHSCQGSVAYPLAVCVCATLGSARVQGARASKMEGPQPWWGDPPTKAKRLGRCRGPSLCETLFSPPFPHGLARCVLSVQLNEMLAEPWVSPQSADARSRPPTSTQGP